MKTDTPLTDKEIIAEQQKIIDVLRKENLRLSIELGEENISRHHDSNRDHVNRLPMYVGNKVFTSRSYNEGD